MSWISAVFRSTQYRVNTILFRRNNALYYSSLSIQHDYSWNAFSQFGCIQMEGAARYVHFKWKTRSFAVWNRQSQISYNSRTPNILSTIRTVTVATTQIQLPQQNKGLVFFIRIILNRPASFIRLVSFLLVRHEVRLDGHLVQFPGFPGTTLDGGRRLRKSVSFDAFSFTNFTTITYQPLDTSALLCCHVITIEIVTLIIAFQFRSHSFGTFDLAGERRFTGRRLSSVCRYSSRRLLTVEPDLKTRKRG